jgi:hypothetical protein
MDPKVPHSNSRPLQEQIREASLDSVAATLASIHLAKQMRARERCSPQGGVSRGIPHDVRIPVHDLIHGLAQLQIEFVQRLLSFNRDATSRIRSALLRTDPIEPGPIEVQGAAEGCAPFRFTIVNRATTTRVLNLCNQRPASGGKFHFTPASPITLAANGTTTVVAECTELPVGVHHGCVSVESRGIRVSLVHYTITVT